MTDTRAEGRIAQVVIVASAAVFLALFLISPPFYQTPDDAKYIGLGLNILEGRGLVTDIGTRFYNHSPLWPLILAAPAKWLGMDALAVGHVLNALFGAATIVLTGCLAWRVRPAVGGVAAAALLGTPYLSGLARTAGLDLPAVAFTLAYAWIALRAIDHDATRLGFVAGVVFGIGFLFKESALPMLPVPFLVALIGPPPAVAIARVAGAVLVGAAITCGWWFALYAADIGLVYRLGTPSWTLAPIVVGLGVTIVACLMAGRIANTPRVRAWLAARKPATVRRLREGVAWGGLAIWTLGQLFVYARAEKLSGLALVRPSQLAADARAYLPVLGIVLGFGIGGTLLAVLVARRSQAVRELAFAAISGLPLVLLVLGIGETPRHYLVVIAALVGLGAAGWVGVIDRLKDRRWWLVALAAGALAAAIALPEFRGSSVTNIAILRAAAVGALALLAAWAAPLFGTPRSWAPVIGDRGLFRVGAVVIAVFLMGATISTTQAVMTGARVGDTAQAHAVETVGEWVNANLPDGSTIITGTQLAYDVAIEVHDHHRIVRTGPQTGLADAHAPLGLRTPAGETPDDVVTLEAALRNADKIDMYTARHLANRIRLASAVAWVQAAFLSKGQTTSAPIAMLDHSVGVRRLAAWTFPAGRQNIMIVVFGLDLPTLAIGDGHVYAEGPAISAMARLLGESRDGGAAASALIARMQPIDSTAATSRAMNELRAVADGS